jgi:hypothetical protein
MLGKGALPDGEQAGGERLPIRETRPYGGT